VEAIVGRSASLEGAELCSYLLIKVSNIALSSILERHDRCGAQRMQMRDEFAGSFWCLEECLVSCVVQVCGKVRDDDRRLSFSMFRRHSGSQATIT
jgi:hypothetical protein